MNKIESSYKCIKKLKGTDGYYDRWKQIRDVYKPQLDTDLFNPEAQYTPHDYTRHCVDIYRIFDIIIPNESFKKDLTTENLFILNVAVIMHDIAMVFKPSARSNHSEEAQKYVLEKVLTAKETFMNSILSDEEATFISDVIIGHSDIKNESNELLVDTISTLPNKNFREGKMGPVNTRMLAGILRIADELDITSWRVSGKHLVKQRISNNSQAHWRKCELFGLPSIPDEDKTVIYLRPNKHKIKLGGDLDNDVVLMLKVEEKINKELSNANKLIFNSGCLSGWRTSRVKIFTNDKDIKQRISKERENLDPLAFRAVNVSEKKTTNSLINKIDAKANNQNIHVVSDNFSKKVEKWVVDNSMLRSGHFYIDSNRYARDWIETHGLLSNLTYLDELSNMFSVYLDKLTQDNPKIHIIGEGFPGIILASILAFRKGYPFTYHIPHQYNENHSLPEKAINVNKNSQIVIVTDVIVTGKTIEKTYCPKTRLDALTALG